MDTVTTKSEDDESSYAEIGLGSKNKKLTFKLDTGAQTSVIPARGFATLMPGTPLITADCKLLGYGGHLLKVKGYCNLQARYKDKSTTQKFHIVDCSGPLILGFKACKKPGLKTGQGSILSQ